MKLIITGSMGNIGRRLMAAFPDAVGVDRVAGADVLIDFDTVDYGQEPMRGLLAGADAIIHLAAEADIRRPDAAHWRSVINAARLFDAAVGAGVTRFVVASSGWAVPMEGQFLNAYAHSKRVAEAMSAMFDVGEGRVGRYVRIGWVPLEGDDTSKVPAWERALFWSDEKLVAEFRKALED